MVTPRLLLVCLSALLLTACEIPGMGPDPRIAQREAEGKAIGGACRQALRGIEDCYTLNEKASKTAVYEGWKEMDAYMRENKLEGQPPQLGKGGSKLPASAATDAKEEIVSDSKPAEDKAAGKPAAKR